MAESIQNRIARIASPSCNPHVKVLRTATVYTQNPGLEGSDRPLHIKRIRIPIVISHGGSRSSGIAHSICCDLLRGMLYRYAPPTQLQVGLTLALSECVWQQHNAAGVRNRATSISYSSSLRSRLSWRRPCALWQCGLPVQHSRLFAFRLRCSLLIK